MEVSGTETILLYKTFINWSSAVKQMEFDPTKLVKKESLRHLLW